MKTFELVKQLARDDRDCVMLADKDGYIEAIVYVDTDMCMNHCYFDNNGNSLSTHSESVQYGDLALLNEYARLLKRYGEERVSYC